MSRLLTRASPARDAPHGDADDSPDDQGGRPERRRRWPVVAGLALVACHGGGAVACAGRTGTSLDLA
jgi:hypothetical protein